MAFQYTHSENLANKALPDGTLHICISRQCHLLPLPTLAFLPLHKHTKLVLTSVPLHLLFLLSPAVFSHICLAPRLHVTSSEAFSDHPHTPFPYLAYFSPLRFNSLTVYHGSVYLFFGICLPHLRHISTMTLTCSLCPTTWKRVPIHGRP